MEYCNQNIHGTYHLEFNTLKSLVGMPKQCRELKVGFNQLENFIGAPEVVLGDFQCYHNQYYHWKDFQNMQKE